MAIGQVPSGGGDEELEGGVFADINITPLTDVVLVLLIIFMVTSSVIVGREGGGAQGGFKVNLPRGGATDVAPSTSDLSVAILADGRIVLSGDVVRDDQLEQAFADAKAKDASTLVVIQADEGVPHGKVVEVMEKAKAAGLAQLAIGVRERPK